MSKKLEKKGSSYTAILLVVVVCILVAGLIFFYLTPRPSKDYSTFYLLKAMKNNDVSFCNKISMEISRQQCEAVITKNENLCGVSANNLVAKDTVCLALIRRDVRLCEYDTLCKAVITKNLDLCNIDKTRKTNLSDEEITKLKNLCLTNTGSAELCATMYSWTTPNDEEIAKTKNRCLAYISLDSELYLKNE